jgi:hypothetical protein
MALDTIVFPFNKDYKSFEKQIGEFKALRAEVELLRSAIMEVDINRRNTISAMEKLMYKRHQDK